jgi:dTMP kinase
MKCEGLLITFEGGEGAGKTTLIENLSARLASLGISVLKTREPGGTPFGERVRHVLLGSGGEPMSPYAELCLFLASRAQHIQDVIGPALQQKKVVLCDRFNDSTIVYQGAARGLGMHEVAKVCAFICQGLEPHLTFYLDIEPKLGLERALHRSEGKDRMEAEGLPFHQKIRDAYLALARQNPKRLHLLDATRPPSQVLEQALPFLEPLLPKNHV